MSGNQVPAILNAGLALKHTFRQVAQHRSGAATTEQTSSTVGVTSRWAHTP